MKKEFRIESLQKMDENNIPSLEVRQLVRNLKDSIKDIPDVSLVERKSMASEIQIDPSEERTFVAQVSTPDVDADGDVVMCEGCDTARYETNPVVQPMHDYSQFPIGKCKNLSIGQKAIFAKIQLASTPEALKVWDLIKGGFLKALSIGFITKRAFKKGTREFASYIKEKALSVPESANRIVSDWALIELSVVPIGSNPEALISSVSAKKLPEVVVETPATAMEHTELEYEPKKALDKNTEVCNDGASLPVEKGDGNPHGRTMPSEPVAMVHLSIAGQHCPREGETCPQYRDLGDFFLQTEHCMDDGKLMSVEEHGWMDLRAYPEMKPMKNEHSFRLLPPTKFDKFRRKNDAFGDGVHAIYGIDSSGTVHLQAIRFSADKWSFEKAKHWVESHGHKPIESVAASGEKSYKVVEAKPKYVVVREGDLVVDSELKSLAEAVVKGKVV